MEEVLENLSQDDVLELIKEFPLEPMGRRVYITTNVEEPDGNLILTNNSFDEVQFVLAVGSHVTEVKAGQKVIIDIEKMLVYENVDDNSHEKRPIVNLKLQEVNGRYFALINDSQILSKDNRITE
tara:strand:- start:87030 stop:87404 length:375 start_codon:yes stop_codon:yes gene_type:complete